MGKVLGLILGQEKCLLNCTPGLDERPPMAGFAGSDEGKEGRVKLPRPVPPANRAAGPSFLSGAFFRSLGAPAKANVFPNNKNGLFLTGFLARGKGNGTRGDLFSRCLGSTSVGR